MGVSTAAGAKFYIGTTASVGSTDSFTEVGQILSISEFGRVYKEVVYTPLSTRGDQKFKGSYNDGGCDLTLGRDTNDTGQVALRVALDVDADYNFKYVPNDAVPAVSAVGVSMTAASPGVVTDTAHGLAVNTPITLVPVGAGVLPTGIVSGTTYYVKTVLTVDTYTVSATAGGSAINTTGSPSGTITRTTVPAPSQQLMKGKVMSYTNNNGTIDSVIGAMCKISLKSGSITETAKIPLA
jgi:hypothetical protein